MGYSCNFQQITRLVGVHVFLTLYRTGQCSCWKIVLEGCTGSVQWTQKNRDLQTLVLMCGCALSVMLLTLAVVLPTPHDYSGPFQGGYSARFIVSWRVLKALSTSETVQREHWGRLRFHSKLPASYDWQTVVMKASSADHQMYSGH